MKILIINKNKVLLRSLVIYLEQQTGFIVKGMNSDEHLSAMLWEYYPQLVIVDSYFIREDVNMYYSANIKSKSQKIHFIVMESRLEQFTAVETSIKPAMVKILRYTDDECDLWKILADAKISSNCVGIDRPEKEGALTLSESKITKMLSAKMSTKQIAQLLSISPETVKNHRKSIKRKLGIQGGKSKLIQFLSVMEKYDEQSSNSL